MNIFYLDFDPKICAGWHVDKHVVKMILEYSQLLSTAHYILDNFKNENLYKPTHINHPSSIWVRSSIENYMWLYLLLEELHSEYSFRYDKIHSSKRLMKLLINPPDNIDNKIEFFDPPLCMPDEFKNSDAILSYRKFYNFGKFHLASWKRRTPPPWFNLQINKTMI